VSSVPEVDWLADLGSVYPGSPGLRFLFSDTSSKKIDPELPGHGREGGAGAGGAGGARQGQASGEDIRAELVTEPSACYSLCDHLIAALL